MAETVEAREKLLKTALRRIALEREDYFSEDLEFCDDQLVDCAVELVKAIGFRVVKLGEADLRRSISGVRRVFDDDGLELAVVVEEK